MGLFSRSEGGLMDVIRCDEQDYLIWKWQPETKKQGKTNKENAIRFGSSIRVKDGEVAVLVYRQKNGVLQDFLVGPYDDILKTDNLPVLTEILGVAYDGKSPFQAEVYYINLSSIIQIPFVIPYFDVYDPRFDDFACPVTVRGKITFSIVNHEQFIKLHRLINFSLEQFSEQVKSGIQKYTKHFIGNAPRKYGFPVVQIERFILELSDALKIKLTSEMLNDFGVTLKRVDIHSIECDKNSEEYKKLYKLTGKQTTKKVIFETNMGMIDSALTDIDDLTDSHARRKIDREDVQRRNKLSAEKEFEISSDWYSKFFDIFKKKDSNPIVSDVQAEPQYFISINGESKGPFNKNSVSEMIKANIINNQTFIWREGMKEWKKISEIPEFTSFFMPPPPPTL